MGAYLLHLELDSPIRLKVGALGRIQLTAGRYVYVGSAKRNLIARIERHKRLAKRKEGSIHWHIDYLLVRREATLVRVQTFPAEEECVLSQRMARRKGMIVPIPRFGASDCKASCEAHLYSHRPHSRRV